MGEQMMGYDIVVSMTNEQLWHLYHDSGKKDGELKYKVIAEMCKRLNYKVVMPARQVIPEFSHWKMQGGQNDRY